LAAAAPEVFCAGAAGPAGAAAHPVDGRPPLPAVGGKGGTCRLELVAVAAADADADVGAGAGGGGAFRFAG